MGYRKQLLCNSLSVLCQSVSFVLLCGLVCAICAPAYAEDWPTYRHDNRRSAVTAEALSLDALEEQWVYEAPYPPQPAWPGPAKWDSYARIIGLSAMRNYDPVFHIVAVGDAAYFGSSVEDAVVCVDARTGAVRWSYTVDGPVRIAPTCSDGKLYFGADDGWAYCLNAADGTLLWKHSPVPDARLIPNNGKLISMWPVRTGVLLDAAKAYFGAALLPWRQAYFCAVDAQTGAPEGDGLYAVEMNGVTMEGALLASPTKLYVPQGRSAPMVLDRADGSRLGGLEGGGGVFALLTPDMHLMHGPGNKTGWITESDAETRDKIASFADGHCMVATQDRAYILKKAELLALDRANKGAAIWQVPCPHTYDLILARDVLFAGGHGEVAAYATRDGQRLWARPVAGRAYALVVANGRLFVSTDTGAIHCFE